MNAIPVIVAGLRRNARKASLPWSRVGAGTLATLPFLFLSNLHQPLAASGFGRAYFEAFVVIAALLGAFAGQLVTADTIGQEAREGTLGLLFLTPLSKWDIILGRISAGGVVLYSLLLAGLPAAAVVWLIGGVAPVEWINAMLALFNVIFVSMAAGMVASAFVRESIPSFLTGFGLIVTVGAVPLSPGYALSESHPGLASLFQALSPVTSLRLAIERTIPATPPPSTGPEYMASLALSHLAGWLLIFVAGLGAERTRRQLATPKPPKARRWFQVRKKHDADAPVAAMLLRHAVRGLPMDIVGPVATAGWLGLFALFLRVSGNHVEEVFALCILGCLLVHFLWRTTCAWQLTQFFYQGRQSGLFELILTTPASRENLLGEIATEVSVRWVPAAILMHLFELIAIAGMGDGIRDEVTVLVFSWIPGFLQLVSLPVIAQAEGLRSKSQAGAMAGVVLKGILIPTLLTPICFIGLLAWAIFAWLAARALRQTAGEVLLGLPSRHTSPIGIIHPLPPEPRP